MAASLEFQAPERKSAWIDLAPVIDIVFLLLVFFMVGARFTQPGLPLDLPEAESGGPTDAKAIAVSIDGEGALYLGSEKLATEELQNRLQAAREENPDQSVVLRADGATPFRYFVRAMDLIRSAGIEKLEIEHERPQL